MPRNGTGTYVPPSSTWNPGVNGVTATTADFNALLTDVAAGITQSVSSDGQTPMTGNLPMGNNKITGLGLGTANTDAASLANLYAITGQAGAASFRNLLINANGQVNQRAYVSATPTTIANQYTVDRWRVVTSGQNLTFTSAAPDSTMTAPAGGLEQVIEGANVIGGVYTLSWTGTATATVNGAAITSGGNTASLTANANVTIRFTGGTVLRPQFELGTVATPYERRQYGLEFVLCQRYLQVLEGGFLGPVVNGTPYGSVAMYPVKMRTTPTITAGGDITASNFGGGTTFTALTDTSFQCSKTANATNNGVFVSRATASAEL